MRAPVPVRLTRRLRARPALVRIGLGAWTPSASAHSDFVPVASPCAPGIGIAGFAVSGPTWLALCSSPGSPQTNALRRSVDHGATWSDVALPLPDGAQGGPETAPDGAFAVVRSTSSGTELVRIDPTTGATTATSGPAPPADTYGVEAAAPGWDGGHTLVAFHGFRPGADAVLDVWRQDGGGWTSLGEQRWDGAIGGGYGFVSVAGATYVRDADQSFLVTSTGLAPVAGIPGFQPAGVTRTPDGLSLDDGATTTFPSLDVQPVEGDPSLFVVGGDVVQPYGVSMLAGTGMRAPGILPRVLRVAGGFVAVSNSRYNDAALAFAADGPESALSPRFAGWLARANVLRATAGLAPLTGDAGISRAAENHSRYWTVNPAPSATLGYHYEEPGRPGFTGERWNDRCAHVGATCDSEIMFQGVSKPIDGWAATVYHRGLLLNPTSVSAGGGKVGTGPAVMDGGAPSGLLIAPTGFPRGAYTGPRDFTGEAPDPAVACKKKGQPVGKPFGSVVTAWGPSGALSDLVVRPHGRSPLRGCRLEETFAQAGENRGPTLHFLPAAALAAGTRYDVSVQWHPAGSAAVQPVSWSFTTGGHASGSARCRATVRLRTRSVRRGRALKVRYRSCARGRLNIRIAGRSRVRLRKTLKVRARKRTSTYAIKTGRLAPGRYVLIATLGRAHHRYHLRVKPRQHR